MSEKIVGSARVRGEGRKKEKEKGRKATAGDMQLKTSDGVIT